MATALTQPAASTSPQGWHPGEVAVHALLNARHTSARQNPTVPGLSPSHGHRVSVSSLLAIGTIDSRGRVWTSLWRGERGFVRPVARNVLGIQGMVDARWDPVVAAFVKGEGEGGEEGGGGKGKMMMSGLAVDLETRDRVKLAGRMVVASLAGGGSQEGEVKEMQMAMAVDEALGNCPKYMNRKEIRAHVPSPRLVSDSLPLGEDGALRLIEKADMMFLSSTNGRTMDTNHRGGPRGFIRVLSNDEDQGVVLVYPEYSGNQLYQSLGNLHINPRVGVVIPDYDISDVLYLTGETELLVGGAAAAVMPHAKVAVRITVKEARFVRDGLSFRGRDIDQSPYNPPVRRLASEGVPGVVQTEDVPAATAILLKRQLITSSIARFTFRLQPGRGPPLQSWRPGQHVTLDFSGELDHGWSHMRDNDPQSLNDDFVRTFTISNRLPGDVAQVTKDTRMEITVRRHGLATGFLWSHKFQVPLELPVLGFGGEESFRIPVSGTDGKKAVFVAGGVGITPLLAQAPGVLLEENDSAKLSLLWSLRAKDLDLAVDAFEKIPGLAQKTQLFITGPESRLWWEGVSYEVAERIKGLEVQSLVSRRMQRDDLHATRDSGSGTKYYLCANPEMHKIVEGWLEGEELVSESFNY